MFRVATRCLLVISRSQYSHMAALVKTRVEDSILYIGINRPEKRNCVNHATALELIKAIDRLNEDESVKIGILYGEGENFCAGYDLSSVATGEFGDVAPDFLPKYRYMGPSIEPLKKPLIAAVEGHAVAGGLELSLMADMRVASRSAVFGVYCRRVGVPLIDGGTVRLPRVIGFGRAMDMILTGRPVKADEAYQFGLANAIVEKGQAVAGAVLLAKEILKHPQDCMLADRRSAYHSLDVPLKEAFDYEFKSVDVLPKAIEGALKFMKKEIPKHKL